MCVNRNPLYIDKTDPTLLGMPLALAVSVEGECFVEIQKKCYILATSGTKFESIEFLQNALSQLGLPSKLVDFETQKHRFIEDAHLVFQPDELCFESRALGLAAAGCEVAKYFQTLADVGCVVAVGGTSAQSVALHAYRSIGRLVPKYLLTTTLMPSAVIEINRSVVNTFLSPSDFIGRNFLLESQINALALAISHSLKDQENAFSGPVVPMTCLGAISNLNEDVSSFATSKLEVIPLHSVGGSWSTIEELTQGHDVRCIMDLSQCELVNDVFLGRQNEASEIRERISKTGVPLILSIGGIFSIISGDKNTKNKLKNEGRAGESVNSELDVFMINWTELVVVSDILALMLSVGNGALVIPKRGVGFDSGGFEPMANLPLLERFSSYMLEHPKLENMTDKIIILDNHINDSEVAKVVTKLARKFSAMRIA